MGTRTPIHRHNAFSWLPTTSCGYRELFSKLSNSAEPRITHSSTYPDVVPQCAHYSGSKTRGYTRGRKFGNIDLGQRHVRELPNRADERMNGEDWLTDRWDWVRIPIAGQFASQLVLEYVWLLSLWDGDRELVPFLSKKFFLRTGFNDYLIAI